MPQMPHEVNRMGQRLRAEVERQLLTDLCNYSLTSADLWIDWSDACQEGHCTEYLGGILEELSGAVVRNGSGVAVADGWMDFVHGGGENPLFVFWLFLSVGSGPESRAVKADVSIPEHVWRRFPTETKDLCTREGKYDGRWARDPKVVAWRQGHPS